MGFFKKMFKKVKKLGKKVIGKGLKVVGGLGIPGVSTVAKIGSKGFKMLNSFGRGKKQSYAQSVQIPNSLGGLQQQIYGVNQIQAPELGALAYTPAYSSSFYNGSTSSINGVRNTNNGGGNKGNDNIIKIAVLGGLGILGFNAISK